MPLQKRAKTKFPTDAAHFPLPTVHFPLPTAREKPSIIEFSQKEDETVKGLDSKLEGARRSAKEEEIRGGVDQRRGWMEVWERVLTKINYRVLLTQRSTGLNLLPEPLPENGIEIEMRIS